MVNSNIHNLFYFPFIFTLFSFLLVLNFLGLVPYTFSVTSQIIITFGLSVSIFIGVVTIGFKNHGLNYFAQFFPAGAPIALAPLLVIIEIVSFSVRALSLGIRLGANLSAGHLLLNILSNFGFTMLTQSSLKILFLLPFLIVYILFGLELATSVIQAFVFCLLTSIYISEAENLH